MTAFFRVHIYTLQSQRGSDKCIFNSMFVVFPPVKCVHVQGKPFHSMCVFNEINTHFQCKVADV